MLTGCLALEIILLLHLELVSELSAIVCRHVWCCGSAGGVHAEMAAGCAAAEGAGIVTSCTSYPSSHQRDGTRRWMQHSVSPLWHVEEGDTALRDLVTFLNGVSGLRAVLTAESWPPQGLTQ